MGRQKKVDLRLEDLGEGRTEWRGQVRHVISGEVRYFRDWPTLIALLQALLAEVEKNLAGTEDGNG